MEEGPKLDLVQTSMDDKKDDELDLSKLEFAKKPPSDQGNEKEEINDKQ